LTEKREYTAGNVGSALVSSPWLSKLDRFGLFLRCPGQTANLTVSAVLLDLNNIVLIQIEPSFGKGFSVESRPSSPVASLQ
jgi:hypothetical protein